MHCLLLIVQGTKLRHVNIYINITIRVNSPCVFFFFRENLVTVGRTGTVTLNRELMILYLAREPKAKVLLRLGKDLLVPPAPPNARVNLAGASLLLLPIPMTAKPLLAPPMA
jgi:hypothetical protein